MKKPNFDSVICPGMTASFNVPIKSY